MIDLKNMNTWPVVFIDQGDVEKITALDGFKSWFHSIGAAPENCLGFNRDALVVYIRGERQSLNDYCFGGVRERNKLLVNDNKFLKSEAKKLNEEVYQLIIENERLKKYKADLGDLPHKYNHHKIVAVTVEELQKKLATSEEIVKETLKQRQKLFNEVQELRVINERMAHENLKASAPSSELQKENWKLRNEAIVLKTRIDNLEREKKCMIENFNAKLREDNLVHENDIKNLNNTMIRLRSEDGGHLVQSLQKGIKRLKDKLAVCQSKEVDDWQEIAHLRHSNKVLEAGIGSREREITRLKPFEGSYDRWQLENRVLQEKLDNIKKSLSGFAGKL